MQKEMCWLSQMGSDGTKILHLRTASHEPWRPYTTFRQYAVPDYAIPHGSKGWATFQKLRQAGWVLVPTAQASHTTALGVEQESEVGVNPK